MLRDFHIAKMLNFRLDSLVYRRNTGLGMDLTLLDVRVPSSFVYIQFRKQNKKTMFELFYAGGAFYMGILTLLFAGMIAVAVFNGLALFKESSQSVEEQLRKLSYVKSVGLFAFMVGVLFQLMGLIGAFQAIEQVGSVSPAMLAGGLKVSMITTVYGLIIYILSYLIWLGLSLKLKK